MRRERRLAEFWGGGPLCRACSEAVVPEVEGLDPARGLRPIIDGTLQAFLPSGRVELWVDVPPVEHRVLQVGRIRWG